MQSQIINYLGQNSYPGIVDQITKKLASTQAETMVGNQLISQALVIMNESITPMMDLKEFTTNAQKLAPNDAKLVDILDFVRKNADGGDLNFLVNMAKEEHFKEMSRAGFPSPEDTIKEFKSLFNETTSIIEQGIKNGLLDKLSSNLMMEIKSVLVDDGVTKINNPNEVVKVINENQVLYADNNLVMYTPIGISMEDPKNSRMLLLTESDVLSFNRATKDFNRIGANELDSIVIPNSHRRMVSAIQELNYNPERVSFSLNENWDFNIELNKSGDVVLINENNKEHIIKKHDLPVFLMESIEDYDKKIGGFNRLAFERDADNLILLTENHSKLINIDNLKTIRNLNENSYVIVEPNSDRTPKLIAGTGIADSQLFESYVNLTEACNTILSKKLVGLFEAQIDIEKEFTQDKFQNIQQLKEEQEELNQNIKEVDSLLEIAEENSPAMQKLNESKTNLSDQLTNNLTNLNNYLNNHKLYL